MRSQVDLFVQDWLHRGHRVGGEIILDALDDRLEGPREAREEEENADGAPGGTLGGHQVVGRRQNVVDGVADVVPELVPELEGRVGRDHWLRFGFWLRLGLRLRFGVVEGGDGVVGVRQRVHGVLELVALVVRLNQRMRLNVRPENYIYKFLASYC